MHDLSLQTRPRARTEPGVRPPTHLPPPHAPTNPAHQPSPCAPTPTPVHHTHITSAPTHQPHPTRDGSTHWTQRPSSLRRQITPNHGTTPRRHNLSLETRPRARTELGHRPPTTTTGSDRSATSRPIATERPRSQYGTHAIHHTKRKSPSQESEIKFPPTMNSHPTPKNTNYSLPWRPISPLPSGCTEVLRPIRRTLTALGKSNADITERTIENIRPMPWTAHPRTDYSSRSGLARGDIFRPGVGLVTRRLDPVTWTALGRVVIQPATGGHVFRVRLRSLG